MKDGYTGRIGLTSSQKVEAPIKKSVKDAPKVKKGGGLRSK